MKKICGNFKRNRREFAHKNFEEEIGIKLYSKFFKKIEKNLFDKKNLLKI